MHCPVDQSVLTMTDRQGVEIDYCPTCRGVWLDRGELDKIVDRSAPALEASDSRHSDRDRRGDHGGDGRRRKKSSALGELFDFG